MRRLTGLVLVTLLALGVLAAPAAAAPDEVGVDTVVLAVDDEPTGPVPMNRLDEENRARNLAGYETPETPFTWGAAWILTFVSLVGLALMGGLYYLLVHRPAREDTERA